MPPVVHTGPRLVIAFAGQSATSLRSLYFWPYHYFLEGAPFYWSYRLFSWMRGYPSRLLRCLPVNYKGTDITRLVTIMPANYLVPSRPLISFQWLTMSIASFSETMFVSSISPDMSRR